MIRGLVNRGNSEVTELISAGIKKVVKHYCLNSKYVSYWTSENVQYLTRNVEIWLVNLFRENDRYKKYLVENRYCDFNVVNGVFTINIDKDNKMIIEKNKYTHRSDNGNTMTITTFNAVFIGSKANEYCNKFIKKITVVKDSTPFYINNDGTSAKIQESKDMVISKEKQALYDYIDMWKKSDKLYSEYGITHKTGILLYGDPGTGKTSLVKQIALRYTMDIVEMDFSQPIDRINLNNKITNTIVLLEEIDKIFSDSSTDTEKDMKINLLLQTLDGFKSVDGVIYIATTNYIDRIEPAILRPGRFNYKVEMKNFDIEEAMDMCDMYDCDHKILDNYKFPCQPAMLQNDIIRHRLKSKGLDVYKQ